MINSTPSGINNTHRDVKLKHSKGKIEKSTHPKIQIYLRGNETRKQASEFPYALPAPQVRATIGNRKEVRNQMIYFNKNQNDTEKSISQIILEGHQKIAQDYINRREQEAFQK